MDLGKDLLESLQVLGDSQLCEDQTFTHVLQKIAENASSVATQSKGSKSQDVALQVALGTLLIECTKREMSSQRVSEFLLDELRFTKKRAISVVKQLEEQRSSIKQQLSRVSSLDIKHVVDVDWRLDYHVKSNVNEKTNELIYLIAFKTQEPGESKIEDVTFTCSLEQLQDLVGKLKDAVRCTEKVAS